MKNKKIIPFDLETRLLKKALNYVHFPERFIADRKQATPILLRALKHMDKEAAHKTILLLALAGKNDIAGIFYEMMTDPRYAAEIRMALSTQISVILPRLKDRGVIVNALLEDIQKDDPDLRGYAAFALGWEGNHQAILPLVNLLYDDEISVRQMAVNALSNLRDDRVFYRMIECLEDGPADQKKCILFNLWRFDSKKDEVRNIYLKYRTDMDPELRFDALILLEYVSAPNQIFDDYIDALNDQHPGIRAFALEKMDSFPRHLLVKCKPNINALLRDNDKKTMAAAIKLYKKISIRYNIITAAEQTES